MSHWQYCKLFAIRKIHNDCPKVLILRGVSSLIFFFTVPLQILTRLHWLYFCCAMDKLLSRSIDAFDVGKAIEQIWSDYNFKFKFKALKSHTFSLSRSWFCLNIRNYTTGLEFSQKRSLASLIRSELTAKIYVFS